MTVVKYQFWVSDHFTVNFIALNCDFSVLPECYLQISEMGNFMRFIMIEIFISVLPWPKKKKKSICIHRTRILMLKGTFVFLSSNPFILQLTKLKFRRFSIFLKVIQVAIFALVFFFFSCFISSLSNIWKF